MRTGRNIKKNFVAGGYHDFVYNNWKNRYTPPVFMMPKINEKYHFNNYVVIFRCNHLLRFFQIVEFITIG